MSPRFARPPLANPRVTVFLGRVSRLLRVRTCLAALLAVLASVLVLLVACLAADMLWALRAPARRTLGLLLAGLGVLGALGCLAAALWGRGREALARRVERTCPDLVGSLRTYVEISGRELDAEDREVAELVGLEAEVVLGAASPEVAVRTRVLGAAGVLFSGALALAVALFALAPGRFTLALDRLVAPSRLTDAPTRAHILAVEPGNTVVPCDAAVTVRARVAGATEATLRIEALDASVPARVHRLSANEDGRVAHTFPGVERSLRYSLAAGDTKSDWFALTVEPAACVTRGSVTVRPPRYTGLEERPRPLGDLEALAGSELELCLALNKPVAEAYLVVTPEAARPGPSPARVRLEPAVGGELTASLRLDRTLRVRAELVDTNGLAGAPGAEYRFVCVPDARPRVAIDSPAAAELRAPPDAVLRVAVSAEDDLGLRAFALRYRTGAGPWQARPLLAGDGGGVRSPVRRAGGVVRLALGRLGVRSGGLLEVYAAAEDTRGGRSESAHLRVTVEEGAPPPSSADLGPAASGREGELALRRALTETSIQEIGKRGAALARAARAAFSAAGAAARSSPEVRRNLAETCRRLAAKFEALARETEEGLALPDARPEEAPAAARAAARSRSLAEEARALADRLARTPPPEVLPFVAAEAGGEVQRFARDLPWILRQAAGEIAAAAEARLEREPDVRTRTPRVDAALLGFDPLDLAGEETARILADRRESVPPAYRDAVDAYYRALATAAGP